MTPILITYPKPGHFPFNTTLDNGQIKRGQKLLIRLIFCSLIITFVISESMATGPEFVKSPDDRPFGLNIGAGYGIANHPLITSDHNKISGGMVLSGSLGYRFSRNFCVEFGPAVWIEGKDIFNNSAANNERPSNKRMLISFNGIYKPLLRMPIHLKFGAGIGSMVYTPAQSIVVADGKGTNNTEFVSGIAGCIGLITEVKLSNKIIIRPSINFTYCDIQRQKIEYVSNINYRKPSITSDFRLNFLLNF